MEKRAEAQRQTFTILFSRLTRGSPHITTGHFTIVQIMTATEWPL